MKCPKCGFVSFPGRSHCKKCGHQYVASSGKATPGATLSLFSGSPVFSNQRLSPAVTDSGAAAPETPDPKELPVVEASAKESGAEIRDGRPISTEADGAIGPDSSRGAAQVGRAPGNGTDAAPESIPAWREELTERVESFRRRRARLREGPDSSLNLDFNFQEASGDVAETAVDAEALYFPQDEPNLDVSLASPACPEIDAPILDSLPLEREEAEFDTRGSASVETSEDTPEESAPVATTLDIVIESPEPSPRAGVRVAVPLRLPVASLGRRFLAGLAHALVLLVAAALFAAVFWRVGGRISAQPLNIFVIGFITAFFIFAYFGLFTALTASTPGLLWMDLEVCSYDGSRPRAVQSFSRAFGYLVSLAGLLLGFIWALVDSEGLTWHDRISCTYITTSSRPSAS